MKKRILRWEVLLGVLGLCSIGLTVGVVVCYSSGYTAIRPFFWLRELALFLSVGAAWAGLVYLDAMIRGWISTSERHVSAPKRCALAQMIFICYLFLFCKNGWQIVSVLAYFFFALVCWVAYYRMSKSKWLWAFLEIAVLSMIFCSWQDAAGEDLLCILHDALRLLAMFAQIWSIYSLRRIYKLRQQEGAWDVAEALFENLYGDCPEELAEELPPEERRELMTMDEALDAYGKIKAKREAEEARKAQEEAEQASTDKPSKPDEPKTK